MKPPKIIFLDVDDVLNRFTMSALEFLGCPVFADDESTYNPAWGYDLQLAAKKLLPGSTISKKHFWSRFPRNFWASISLSAECDSLLTTCVELVGRENVCLLTKPSGSGDCAAGKVDWINSCMPVWIRNQYLIGEPKHFCASKRSLLIDDNPWNTSKFAHAGGRAILVPRPWNPLHGVDSLDFIRKRLTEIFQLEGSPL